MPPPDTMSKILYFFDPLCGWCYAVGKNLARLAETAEVDPIPTGLFAHSGKKMDERFSRYAWSNDRRIADLTGQTFSEHYRRNILGQNGNFDSFNLTAALTAVRQTAPERELELLSVFQTARYIDGLDTAVTEILASILNRNGLPRAADLLNDPALREQTEQRIRSGRALAGQLGISGVPGFAQQTGRTYRLLTPADLFDTQTGTKAV
ncbi:DsbA family protein [Neisseria leonii]|uniref:DsbA family protein n=1 Tax=Neisseria leonii TaxID=2995413 RepID=UPI00237B6347|nr:DsbA family protein [Neisseria sp. 3986]MDD9325661.1 DsbA family protein [Neisseria sp. 3986]